MKTKNIIILTSSIFLLGAGVGTFFYFRNKKKLEESTNEEEEYGETEKHIDELGGSVANPSEEEYSEKQKVSGSNYPLKIGSKGRKVAVLQSALKYDGANISIDGSFGNQTRFALLKSGFASCVVASSCSVSKIDFGKMLGEIKDLDRFKKQYNINNNTSMKKVWDKYKS